MLEKLIKIANELYDGHFTIMKFTTNYRVCFGTVSEREDIKFMAEGKTLDEAIMKAINNRIDYRHIRISKEKIKKYKVRFKTKWIGDSKYSINSSIIEARDEFIKIEEELNKGNIFVQTNDKGGGAAHMLLTERFISSICEPIKILSVRSINS